MSPLGPPAPPSYPPRRAPAEPGWGKELRRMVLLAVFVAVLATGGFLLAATGLLRHRGETVEASVSWAGILAAGAPAVWAFLSANLERAGIGVRRAGMPSLAVVGALLAAAVQLLAMTVWPVVLDPDARAVLAAYPSDPLALGSVAGLVIAVHAWCALGLVLLGSGGTGAGLAGLGLILGTWLVGSWPAIRLLEGPPSAPVLVVWALVAAAGLALLPSLAALLARR